MSSLGGIKKWLSDQHEQGIDKIIKDFYMQFNGTPLVKTTQRSLSGREVDQELVHRLQNKRIYTVEIEAIEKKHERTKRKLEIFCLKDLDNNLPVKAKIEKVKAELLERAKLWYELRENGVDFSKEKMKRLYDLEKKYGNERTMEYLRFIDKELEKMRSGSKSFREYEEGIIAESKETRDKSQQKEIQSSERGIPR